MGWTSKKISGSFESVFEEEFNQDGYTIIKYNKVNEPNSGTFKGHSSCVIYAAVKHPKGHVFGLVVLFAQDHEDVYWKEMDESQGPAYHNASKEVMSTLSDFKDFPDKVSEHSVEWRKKVTLTLNNRKYG